MPGHSHRHVATRSATLIVAVALGTTGAGAQRETSVITGRVVDARSHAPIPGAAVGLGSSRRPPVVVDSSGRFVHAGLAAGTHRIEVRAIGFAPGAWIVVVAEDDTVAGLQLALHPHEYLLPAVDATAEAESRNRGLREFERRRASGQGIFVTPEEIERRRPHTLGDILRGVPGVTTACDRVTGCYIRMLRAARSCRAEIFVDGVSATLVVQAETPATDILAVEVYRSESETPSEFVRLERTCGVVAIWTRAAHVERP